MPKDKNGLILRKIIEEKLKSYGFIPENKKGKYFLTYFLLGLIALIFVLQVISNPLQDAIDGFSVKSLYLFGGNNQLATFGDGQIWRLLSAALLHANLLHTILNGFALYSFGKRLEEVVQRNLLFIFIFTGITGSLFSVLFGKPQIISIGASGAIFGLIGFSAAYGFGTLQERLSRLKSNFPSLLIIFISSALIPGIDNFGHLGGLVGGILLAFLYPLLSKLVRSVFNFISISLLLYTLWQMWQSTNP